jgi:hypothetical protein
MRAGETWREIKDFPGYSVSDTGYVWSHKSEMRLSASPNNNGILKVNLVRDGQIHTRSVKTMVANEFLPQQLSLVDGEQTPINIDGDHFNNHVRNLAWRPRWFAWKYAHQFNADVPQEYLIQVINETKQVIYPNVMEAGIAEGLLWEDVYKAMMSGKAVYPSGSHFDFNFVNR